MRKSLGLILLGLGSFLLFIGLLAIVWAPDKAERTPLDVDSTTYLTGEGGKLDLSTGEIEVQDLQATSVTRTDSEASDEDVAVWVSTSCLVIQTGDTPPCGADQDDERLINASEEVFATDRYSGEAVNGDDYLPEGTREYEGLVNKWPFKSEKKTYAYFDSTLGETVDAVYDRTENLEGLETYVYAVEVGDAPIEIAEGVPGTYDTSKEIFVEPRTGAIVNHTFTQQRTLEDGTVALDIELAFTEDQVADSVAATEDSLATLNLLTQTVPIVGLGGGLLALAIGLFLVLGERRRQPVQVEERPLDTAGV